MKKLLCLLLASALLLCSAGAEGLGVQMVSQPQQPAGFEPVNVTLIDGESVDVPGWGRLTVSRVQQRDQLGYYSEGSPAFSRENLYESGAEADYLVVYADILNTTADARNYLEDVSVRAFYGDAWEYEFTGWQFQRNFGNGTNWLWGPDENEQNMWWVILAADIFPIQPMQEGHYAFGCTLYNAAFEMEKPLIMVITIDGNVITVPVKG